MINVNEAKTNLSRFIRKLKPGEAFTICVRNKPVAEVRKIYDHTNRSKKKIPWGMYREGVTIKEGAFDPLPDSVLEKFYE